MDRAKTTARWDKKHLSFGIWWHLYLRFDGKPNKTFLLVSCLLKYWASFSIKMLYHKYRVSLIKISWIRWIPIPEKYLYWNILLVPDINSYNYNIASIRLKLSCYAWNRDCKFGRHILWHCTNSIYCWWHGTNLDWDYTWAFKSPSCAVLTIAQSP